MMEGPKWEELPMDCLVEVLGRVGLESLLVDVPFVCKSWHKATRTPFCWKELDFDIWYYSFIDRFKSQCRLEREPVAKKFLKVVVNRSAGCTTTVILPFFYSASMINYVAKRCPALKKLVLHSDESSNMLALSLVIGKFKNLESLELPFGLYFEDIVTEIGAHCVNFVSLSLLASSKSIIGEEEAMAIVSSLPDIKCLSLRDVGIDLENLIKILKGCVLLVHLNLRDCFGFNKYDEELSKLASHIRTFECLHSPEF